MSKRLNVKSAWPVPGPHSWQGESDELELWERLLENHAQKVGS